MLNLLPVGKVVYACYFGDGLDDMLREGFVVGLLNEATQSTLLTELDFNFNKVVSIALARETADKDVMEMGCRLTVFNMKPSTGA